MGFYRKKFQRSKKGYRKDLGYSCDSSWEANFARAINYLFNTGLATGTITRKTKEFLYAEIKTGVRVYNPDFRIDFTSSSPEQSDGSYIWIEIKGYWYPQSKTKLRRLKKYYPEEFARLVVVCKNSKDLRELQEELGFVHWDYSQIEKYFKDVISGWE